MSREDYYRELRTKIVRYCYIRNENMIINVIRFFKSSKIMSDEYLDFFLEKKEIGVCDSVVYNKILDSDYYIFLTEIFFYLDDNKLVSSDMNFEYSEYNKMEYILAFKSFCSWHDIENIYLDTF